MSRNATNVKEWTQCESMFSNTNMNVLSSLGRAVLIWLRLARNMAVGAALKSLANLHYVEHQGPLLSIYANQTGVLSY